MEYIRLSNIDFRSNINNRVFITFLASDVDVRLQKDKVTPFITLNMVDKDCSVEARLFRASQKQIDTIVSGKAFNAAVDIKPYDKAPSGFSCIIYNIEESSIPTEYFADWAEDLPDSQKIIEEAIYEINNSVYGRIAYPIIIKYWDKFYTWTAAKSQHHNQLGGLITHTAEVIRLADDMADLFNSRYGDGFINRQLLMAAALLHDLGKVQELDVDTSSGHTEYSVKASLGTHTMSILTEVDIQAYELSIGEQEYEVDETNEEVPIKSEEKLKEEEEAIALLKHCLGSHHGKLEWGSTITPNIPEAYIIHTADMLSSEMFKYNKKFKEMDPGSSDSVWGPDGLKVVYKELGK